MPEDKQQENEKIFPESEFLESNEPKSIRDRFMDFYYGLIPLFTINLTWFLMILPVVTIFPATGGLYYAVLELERENTADWNTVWEGVKKHWWLSLKWGLLILFGNIFMIANVWFYLNLDQGWSIFPLTLSIVVLIIWSAITQFGFPMLLLQEEKKIFLALRNAYVIVVRKPLSALKVLLIGFLTTVISLLLLPLWIFVSMAWIIRIRTKTVLKAVDEIKQRDIERDAVIAHREGSDSHEDQENHSSEE